MTRLALTSLVAVLAALALASVASASPRGCAPGPTHGVLVGLDVTGAPCSTARALLRFTQSHEALDGRFRALGRVWTGRITSRYPANTTSLRFTSGRVVVRIFYAYPIS